MNTVIIVEVRKVFGEELNYIISEHAQAINALTGKKTINTADIAWLELLGFYIQIKRN